MIQRKSEFSNHIVRQIIGSAASESDLLEEVSLSSSWIGQLEDRFFTEASLPKNDTTEARNALSWLTSQILKEDYPEVASVLPFLRQILVELRSLEQEGGFDQTALRSFAMYVAKLQSEASEAVARLRDEYVEESGYSEESDLSDDEEEDGPSFANNLKLGTAFSGARVYRRRGSFIYSTSVGEFPIPGTQSQIDLHKQIQEEGEHSFRGNRVKVRLQLFWVVEKVLVKDTLSKTVSEDTTFRSADHLSTKAKEELVPKVRSLLRVVGDPYEKKQMGTLLHSERDLAVKLDEISDFPGKVREEILSKAPKGAKLLILALEVHSCKNKVCSRCDSVLRSLSRGGWKGDVTAGLGAYDTSELKIIIRAGSDEGSGEEINKLTRDKENTLETFTPTSLPSILDIQPLERMKHFPELKKFSDQL